MISMNSLLPTLIAFFAVLILIPALRTPARLLGLVDRPGGRKQHQTLVPLTGGLIIFSVYMIVMIASGIDLRFYWPLFVGLIMLMAMGVIDDRYPMNPWLKFGVQIAVAFLVVLVGHVRLYHLGNLFNLGNFSLGFMSIPFSVAAVTLLINAMNLMDGLDGLAGGKSLVVFSWLILACILTGEIAPVYTMAPLVGALAGFLFHNMRSPWRKQASVFLGDAGSMSLGLIIAWFSIALVQDPAPPVVPISVAWILALPIIDACGQFYRRVKEGRHPFSPDRGHFHHHFIHAGVPVGASTMLILLLGFVLGGIGYVGVMMGIPPVILTLSWIILLLSHMVLSQKPERYIAGVEKVKRIYDARK